MRELLNNSAFLALLGTIFGGAGLKIIESWLGKAKQKQDQGAAIRQELRMEIKSLRDQLSSAAVEERRLEAELERWRGLYYDLRDEKQKVVTELTIVMERLRHLNDESQK